MENSKLYYPKDGWVWKIVAKKALAICFSKGDWIKNG